MLTRIKTTWMLVLIGAILLSACGASPQATPTVDAGTQLTAVASTVQAELTQAAAKTPSAATPTTPPTPTVTEVNAAATQPELNVEPTLPSTVLTPVDATALPTLALIPTAVPTKSASGDKALLIGQDPADNTVMKPGQKFKVTWSFRNVGTTTWSKKYSLRFYAGTKMHQDPSKTISSVNPPGGDTNFTVSMVAPSKVGDYRSGWVITNDSGENFMSVFIAIKVKN